MATWPTAAELQARYQDLLPQETTVIDQFIADAKARVLGVMGDRYQISLWIDAGSAVPPQARAWVARLAHAYFHQDIHFGAAPQAGSDPATTVRNQVEEEMKEALEAQALVDDDGVPIPVLPAPSFSSARPAILLRTLRPVFGMGARERERVLPPDPDSGTISPSRWR